MAKTRLAKGDKSKAEVAAEKAAEYFVDVSLPVPAAAQHLILDPVLKLRYGTKSIPLIQMASSSLLVSRRLLEGDSISGGHGYVLALGRMKKNLNRTSKELQRDVQQMYEGWKRDLQSDVITLTMFAENKLLNEATPYDESDEDDKPQYDWLEQDIALPEPPRDLTNPYEKRLKQIIDFLTVCGYEFGKEVENAINEGILAAIRGLGAETDDAGFQPGTTGDGVHANPVSDVAERGDNTGGRETAVLGAADR
jgi:hypothetical protein